MAVGWNLHELRIADLCARQGREGQSVPLQFSRVWW